MPFPLSASHPLEWFDAEQPQTVGQDDLGAAEHHEPGGAEIRVEDRLDRHRAERLVAHVHHVVEIAHEHRRLVLKPRQLQHLVEGRQSLCWEGEEKR